MSEAERYSVRVLVFPRPEILDPQGKAIASALGRLDFDEVESVRAGKSFELTVRGASREAVAERVGAMCEKLLANPIIEDYEVEVGEPLAEEVEP